MTADDNLPSSPDSRPPARRRRGGTKVFRSKKARQRFLDELARGGTWANAVSAIGSSMRSWRRVRDAADDPETPEALRRFIRSEVPAAWRAGEAALVDRILAAGKGGGGRPADWRADAWVLERTRRGRWGRHDRHDVEVRGKVDVAAERAELLTMLGNPAIRAILDAEEDQRTLAERQQRERAEPFLLPAGALALPLLAEAVEQAPEPEPPTTGGES